MEEYGSSARMNTEKGYLSLAGACPLIFVVEEAGCKTGKLSKEG